MTYSIEMIYRFELLTVEYTCDTFDEKEMRVYIQTYYPQAEIQNWTQTS
jgi:hypothetical protein